MDNVALGYRIGLSRGQAKVFALLMEKDYVTADEIGSKRELIWMIRSRVVKWLPEIRISNIYSVGWWIHPRDKARLRERVGELDSRYA